MHGEEATSADVDADGDESSQTPPHQADIVQHRLQLLDEKLSGYRQKKLKRKIPAQRRATNEKEIRRAHGKDGQAIH